MLWVPSNPDGVKSKRGIATEKVIRRLMKSEHLRVYVPRIKRFSSYQGEISPDVPNLLQRNFHADKLNQKWLADITEFSIPSGKVYLSPVIDCLDGLPVAWTVGTHPDEQLVNVMLLKATAQLKIPLTTPIEARTMDCSDRKCRFTTINVEKSVFCR